MSEAASEGTDRFSAVWPVIAAIFGLIGGALASASKFDALTEIALLPAVAIGFVVAVVWFVILLSCIFRRRWRRAVSALVAVPAALLMMPGLWSDFDLASQVRLAVNRADYDRRIASLPIPTGQRRARWDWGGTTTAVTGGDLCSLVYDESNSLQSELRAGRVWPKDGRPWFDPDSRQPMAKRLEDHFYLVEEFVP